MKKVNVLARIIYVFLTFLCFYLLFISRSWETHTVWEVLHPMFTPAFFATTVLLVAIVFSSERIELKLVFIVFYAILARSFSAIVFPAGVAGAQQAVLAGTRRVYDNTVFHGLGGTVPDLATRVFNWFKGTNFQSVYSVMFARMFGVDILWIHLFLAPVLWGVFTPTIAFLIAKTLFNNERIWVFSGLLTSAFPLLVSWGTISVPNSLGYIFFLSSLYFSLKYVSCQERSISFLLVMFVVASFMAHPLSGITSLSFAILAFSLKTYEREKAASPLAAKFMLLFSMVFCISLLPLALTFYGFFSHTNVYFSLDKIAELSVEEKIGLFVFGEYWNFDSFFLIVHMAGPVLGFVGILCVLWMSGKQRIDFDRQLLLFSLFGFIVVLVNYRMLKLFMEGLPFDTERVWVFRDFTILPFAVFAVEKAVAFFLRKDGRFVHPKKGFLFDFKSVFKLFLPRFLGLFSCVLVTAGWIFASVYFGSAYPYYSPLQITWYENEAVRFIDETSNESYVVIGDRYTGLAGGMFVGVYNPRAYYFPLDSPNGSKLFYEMKMETTRDVMLEAMEINNATIAYFVIQKARLPDAEYYGIVERARVNGVQTYEVFYDSKGVEKLRIFVYKNTLNNGS